MSTADISRSYCYGECRLTLRFGDLTTSDADVLVSSDDYYLSMGGGVSAAILVAGGEAIALDAAKHVPSALGEVVVTTAGILPAQYIFHAVTIGPLTMSIDPKEIVRQTTSRCLRLLNALGLKSIAFPAIGSGAARFSFEDVASEMADAICDEASRLDRPIEVTVYLMDRYGKMTQMDFVRFFEECAMRVPRLVPTESQAKSPNPAKNVVPAVSALETGWHEMRSRQLHGLSKLIGSLQDHRFKIEGDLITALSAGDVSLEATARESLRQNEKLRLGYLAEIKTMRSDSSEPTNYAALPKTVFVSSTYADLVEHRMAVKDQIVRRDLFFRGMEHFGADSGCMGPPEKIVEEVRKADVYLGIFGFRYGSIEPSSGLSMTELEYAAAEAGNKSMLLYVMQEDAFIRAGDFEVDPTSKKKLDDLRARIRRDHIVYMFKTVDDLKRQVFEDLGKILSSTGFQATA